MVQIRHNGLRFSRSNNRRAAHEVSGFQSFRQHKTAYFMRGSSEANPFSRRFLELLKLSFLWVGLIALLGVWGCGDRDEKKGQEEAIEKPYAGLTIDVAIPAGRNLASDWELPVSEWSVQHDAECRLQEYALPEGSGKFSEALAQATGERPEVMLLPWSAVPELVAQDDLAEIPEAVQHPEQLNWYDIFPGLRNRVARFARKPRLVPVSSPILVCYYRQDLLEEAKLSSPNTWAEYQTLLETLKDWAPGLSAVEPWSESFRATMFLARSASMAKHPEQLSFCFQLSDAAPLIANPGFMESLKLSKRALELLPEEVKTYSPGDCRREILAGRAALAIGYETDLGQELVRAENLQIGICQLPGSTRVYNTAINDWVEFEREQVHHVTLTGFDGWALAVSAPLEATLSSAAWELTRYMAVDQLPGSFPTSMVSPCRDSQILTPTQWTGRQLTTLESDQYVSIVAEALRSDQLVMEFPLLGNRQYRDALTQGLTKALGEASDEATILQQVAEDWRKIIEQIGQEAVITSHQRSHE